LLILIRLRLGTRSITSTHNAGLLILKSFEDIEVVRREDVNKYFGIDQMHNVTKKDITAADFSEEQIDFIERAYVSDYAFLEKYGVKNGKAKSKRKNS